MLCTCLPHPPRPRLETLHISLGLTETQGGRPSTLHTQCVHLHIQPWPTKMPDSMNRKTASEECLPRPGNRLQRVRGGSQGVHPVGYWLGGKEGWEGGGGDVGQVWKQDTDNLTRRDLEAAGGSLNSAACTFQRIKLPALLPGKPMEDTGREGNRTGPQALFRMASCKT